MTDRQFIRAHNQYLTPPEERPMDTCPECEGNKTIPCSDCCESEMRNGRCMECGENCKEATCPTCEGTGRIKLETVREEEPDRESDLL